MSEAIGQQAATESKPANRNITLGLVAGSHGVNHSYVPLMPLVWARMMADIGMTYTQLGWMLGVTNIIGGIIQLWFGSISGVVKRKHLLGIGSIVAGVSTGANAIAASFSHVLWLRVANRVGGAPQHPCGNSIIAEQFEKKTTRPRPRLQQLRRPAGHGGRPADHGILIGPL